MSPKGIKKCHFLAIFSTFLRKYGRSGCLERLDSIHELGAKSFPQLFLLILFSVIVLAHAYARTYLLIEGLQKEDLQNEKKPRRGP